jgi:hypothetical protein
MIAYARKTNTGNYKDILVLDTPAKRKSLVKVISDTIKIYPWAAVIDLGSLLPDETDYTPNVRKNITRKIKDKPLIKPIYNLLLKLYLRKKQSQEIKSIQLKLSEIRDVHELNLLTQTGANEALFKLYPKAAVNYFEHGQGDYFFIQKLKPVYFNFYCVFADKFKQYLQKNKQDNSYVKNVLDAKDFPALANEVIDADENKEKIKSYLQVEGKLVLILLESVEIYNVPDNFWTDYLDLCLSQISNPSEYTFILKPHHLQSLKAIEISKNYMLHTRKLNTLVIESNHSLNYSVEILYALWQNNTHYVFSVFSSALYYIAKLYGTEKTTYYYAYDFFRKYIDDAPKQFIYIYNGIEDIIKNVLAENCINISERKSN